MRRAWPDRCLAGLVLQLLGMFGVFLLSAVIYWGCVFLLLIARVPGTTGLGARHSLLRDLAGGVARCLRQPLSAANTCDHDHLQSLGFSVHVDDSDHRSR